MTKEGGEQQLIGPMKARRMMNTELKTFDNDNSDEDEDVEDDSNEDSKTETEGGVRISVSEP